MDSCACVYICAHTGWGKTSVIEKLLEKTPHTYISLWDQDAIKQALDDTTGFVVLDDFQALYDYKEGQAAVVELLRAYPAGSHYLLLSRAEGAGVAFTLSASRANGVYTLYQPCAERPGVPGAA